jgi:hypothetical protein
MAEFKLGRLRFVWKNVWTNSTTYVKDDIVRYGGKAYVCVLGHIADSDATGGFETDLVAGKWQLMNDGQSWGAGWATNVFYRVNDIVNYGGRSYIAVTSHTSAATAELGLEADQSKWNLFNDGIAFKGTWDDAVRYKLNDMVSYGGQVYICNTPHTSTVTFDTAKFTMFATGLQFEGAYDNAVTYQPGDVVSYGANTFVASVTTVGNLPTDANFWTVITQGVVYKSTYNNSTLYKKGDIVTYGASAYVAKQDTTGNLPSDTANWETMVSGLQTLGVYSGSTDYVKGDIVQYGGYSYVAKTNTTGNLPTVTANWDLLTKGYTYSGEYSGATAYKPGELVSYGGSIFAAKVETTGNAPSNSSFWDLFSQGFKFAGEYNGATQYKVGEIVKHGAKLYITIAESTGNLPTNGSFFTLYVDGVRLAGTFTNGANYLAGDIVRYGARSYVCILAHTANPSGGIEPPNPTYWTLLAAGMFWRGTYSETTEYELDDTVEYLGSTWISISANNVGNEPSTSATKWNLVAQTGDVTPVLTTAGDLLRKGTSGSVERIPVGTDGQILTVGGSGLPVWEDNNVTGQVFYVATEGNDGNDGSSINRAFASIQGACSSVTGPATIFVKSGTYTETLPIIVPENVAIVGDSMRTTIIQPAVGDTTETMFLMSNGSLLQKVAMQGLDGFTLGTPGDVDTSTPGGVFIALNPASPVLTKSPYIVECSCFSTGGIGAIVDGAIHGGVGFGSMLFHGYTMNNDGGIGIWTSNNGRAEVVSCFTYFCDYGYAASSGGQIRSLNGNNSYGRYGAIAGGFDSSETPITGNLYGSLIEYTAANGIFDTGETLTSPTGEATILSSQASAGLLYIKVNTGTFEAGQTITGTATQVQATIKTGGVTGQKGFLVIASGLTAEPQPGSSLSLGGSGGTFVVQNVDYNELATGYKPAGFAIMTLTNEKLTESGEGTTVSVRVKYSKVRLTGHDFLAIGSGQKATAYPIQTSESLQVNEIVENLPGRVFYVSTDQDGNFRVGDFFKVDQATGRATLNANAFDLSGLTSLRLGSIGAQLGEQINEFSADGTLSGNSNLAVPTERAIKTYVDTNINSLSVAFSIALA